MGNERALSARDVADRLQVRIETARALIRTGRIRAVDISQGRAKRGKGRPTYRVAPAEVERYLRGQ